MTKRAKGFKPGEVVQVSFKASCEAFPCSDGTGSPRVEASIVFVPQQAEDMNGYLTLRQVTLGACIKNRQVGDVYSPSTPVIIPVERTKVVSLGANPDSAEAYVSRTDDVKVESFRVERVQAAGFDVAWRISAWPYEYLSQTLNEPLWFVLNSAGAAKTVTPCNVLFVFQAEPKDWVPVVTADDSYFKKFYLRYKVRVYARSHLDRTQPWKCAVSTGNGGNLQWITKNGEEYVCNKVV